MKKLNEVPDEVLKSLERRRIASIIDAISRDHKYFCTLPVRPARMRLLTDNGNELAETIVPATDIYLKNGAFLDKDYLVREGLTYFVSGTRKAFPLAHVYRGNGNICFGDIFVPAKIPRYSPQTPLETLFLHNDRVLSHGGASLILTDTVVENVRAVLDINNLHLPDAYAGRLSGQREMLQEDDIWHIAAWVRRNTNSLDHAINVMAQVYEIIFKPEKESV